MQVSDHELSTAGDQLITGLYKRMKKHGKEQHSSVLETVAVCQLELNENYDAIQKRHDRQLIANELMDLAVAAIWGYLSLKETDSKW